jgi:uncharacterized membrane protein YqaE (UPF0057 family)
MNTKTFLYSLSLFALSSCASLKNSEFSQRKYYDFPRTKHTVKGKQTEYASLQQSETKLVPTLIVKEENKTETQDLLLSASANDKEITLLPKSKTFENHSSSKTNGSTLFMNKLKQETATIVGVPYKKSDVVKVANKLHKLHLSDSDAMLILLVVLAFFIPPLAVYIKNNHKTDNWFVLTLILWLLSFVGFGYTPFYGLWFVASVIALLVVFDILH